MAEDGQEKRAVQSKRNKKKKKAGSKLNNRYHRLGCQHDHPGEDRETDGWFWSVYDVTYNPDTAERLTVQWCKVRHVP